MSVTLGGVWLRRLLEAAEIVHAQARGPFEERLFEASRHLFGEVVHTFEVYTPATGGHRVASDIAWPEHRRSDLERLMGEVVPIEHPLFLLQAAGPRLGATRLSDHITRAALERTVLYNELFTVARVRHQMGLVISVVDEIAVLTVSRWSEDFADDELTAAMTFARHARIAHESSRLEPEAGPVSRERGIARATDPFAVLPPSLARVAQRLALGDSDKEIALRLGMSLPTVRTYATRIFERLGVRGRRELMVAYGEALRRGSRVG